MSLGLLLGVDFLVERWTDGWEQVGELSGGLLPLLNREETTSPVVQ